jgi:SAM-dependent methyltransferase
MDDLYTLLERVEAGDVVLDLGCGHGSFHYEKCRGRIVAMDIALPENARHMPQVTYIRADSSAIPLSAGSVDVVVSHHTLEHFPNYKETLNEIRRVLNPKGWLWIAVPNGYGFDDKLYRFVFAGGGHVNRFEYKTLVREVEAATGTRLQRSCDLFTSFIYLRRPAEEELQHYPARAGFLGEIPSGFLTFIVLALNASTRLCDKLLGSRYSQYGWGFVFSRGELVVDAMPSYFNVCRQCGSGNDAQEIRKRSRRSIFGLRLYHCPHCGEFNVGVTPPRNLM